MIEDTTYETPTMPLFRDPSEIRSFISSHGTAAAFELRYSVGDNLDSSIILGIKHDFEQADITGSNTIYYAQLGSDQPLAIDVTDVESISTIESIEQLIQLEGVDITEGRYWLEKIAERRPQATRPADIKQFLSSSHPTRLQIDALKALDHIATTNSERARVLLPELERMIQAHPRLRALSIGVLTEISKTNPTAVESASDQLIQTLPAVENDLRISILRCIANIGEVHPETITSVAPHLEGISNQDAASQSYGLVILNQIAKAQPTAIKPLLFDLKRIASDSSAPDVIQADAITAIGWISDEYPYALVDSAELFGALLAESNTGIQAAAAGVLGDIARANPTRVLRYTDQLATLLTADHASPVVNATIALGQIAEKNPSAVQPYSEPVAQALDHNTASVRANACWLLGVLRATDVVDTLEKIASTDEDQSVRSQADWAVERIKSY